MIPAPRRPSDTTDVDRRSRMSEVLAAVGQIGSAVSLSALLVLAAAVGAAVDGQPADGGAPLSVTFDTAH